MFVVDWDGTCVEEVWPGMGDWLPGAVDALRWMSSVGKTVIYSLRCSEYEVDDVTPRNPADVRWEQGRIRSKLIAAGLHKVEVYPNGRGKPPGKFYVDDRGVRFEGDWQPVLEFIQSRLPER